MSEGATYAIVVASIVGFAAVWLLVTFAIARFTPWSDLEKLFPNKRAGKTKATFRFQSAYMGRGKLGTSFGGCVTYQVTERGLRIAIWKLFMPFAQPMLIPWDAIEAEQARVTLVSVVRLKVGPRGRIWLTLSHRLAEKIAQNSAGAFVLPPEKA